jgi:hypothetical protein
MAGLPEGSQRDAVSVRIEQLHAAAEMYDLLMLRGQSVALR